MKKNKLQRVLDEIVIPRFRMTAWTCHLDGVPKAWQYNVTEQGMTTPFVMTPRVKDHYAIGQFFQDMNIVGKEYQRRYHNKFNNQEAVRLKKYVKKLNDWAANNIK